MLIAPWHRLHISKDLACEFLGIFSRYEYALKAAGFIHSPHGHVQADWPRFAQIISPSFNANVTAEVANAVAYLLASPPLQQALGTPPWVPVTIRTGTSQMEELLIYVRTVRNNLFHGGKFLPQPPTNPDRDIQLVVSSLMLLSYCITLEQQVEQAFLN